LPILDEGHAPGTAFAEQALDDVAIAGGSIERHAPILLPIGPQP